MWRDRGILCFISGAIWWLFYGVVEDIFFGLVGETIKDYFSEIAMKELLVEVFHYGPPVVAFIFGGYFLFIKTDEEKPDWTLREAFKYLMLDSK